MFGHHHVFLRRLLDLVRRSSSLEDAFSKVLIDIDDPNREFGIAVL